jgi:hypothetical protein
LLVIPAEAGIQLLALRPEELDPGFARMTKLKILRATGISNETGSRQRPQVVECRGMDALAVHEARSERRKTLIGMEVSLRRW